MSLRLRPLERASAPAWDAFVAAMPDGTFCHRAGWAHVLETAFGHRSHYVYAERDGAIVGVLPLARMRSLLFGHSLVSSPFCVYGGPLAADEEARRALEERAEALRAAMGATVLEFRERRRVDSD
ncbi:MAG: peptidoglycan bridge formation protein FemAB, partial [Rhodospirillales bacterium]|nr:peptidoglycan bridge formation protein FemAB [Rhodospirillales bacterium]